MKKYLLAGLTGILSLFLGLFVCFGLFGNADAGIAKFLEFLILAFVITSTGFVYKKFDKTDLEKKAFGGLKKDDRKAFEKTISKINLQQAGIEEFIVTSGKDGVSDFVIGIRTRENIKPDYELIKNELYKTFFPQIKFVFINMNVMGEEGKRLFSAGTKIKTQ